uniref:MMS19 nucleotide excision repair protein n=1 Tax=Callorhinchus milii TaxID=7868 RepID=A0A4W3IBR0_CALMI
MIYNLEVNSNCALVINYRVFWFVLGVIDGKYAALDVVEALGTCLTNPEPRTRGRGVQLLSQVLQVSYSILKQKEVEVLTIFYIDRLKDHHLITSHVLQGMKFLSLSPVLPEGLAVATLKALFQEVHVQSLMQSERHSVYSIISNFMETREKELKGLGADFIFGFIQAMDGEKDPRNLLMAFQISREMVTKKYELGAFVEELFEVTSCYFPIDFTPPPNDPHGISQEELILSLRAILASTPRFAEFLLPLLIEKLDSDVQPAKVDSLQTLTACCNDYRKKEVKDFLPALWSSIRREVFQTASEKIESEGLSALQALSTCLSRSVIDSDAEDSLDSFLNNVLQDCKHHLCEPDMKLVWPSAKLLQAAASGSHRATYKITTSVLPLLLEEFNKHTQSSQRWTILGILESFIKLTHKWERDDNPLSAFKDQLCLLVFSALTDSSVQLQIVGTSTLAVLGTQQGDLLHTDTGHHAELCLSAHSAAAMAASVTMSRIHPSAFITRMVPAMTGELSTEPMEVKESRGLLKAPRQRCVQALAAISTHPDVLRHTVPVLLRHLMDIQKGSLCTEVEDAVSACRSLQLVAEQCQVAEESSEYFHQTVVPCLLGLAVRSALQGCGPSILCEEPVIAALGTVISTAYSHTHTQPACRTIARVVSLYLDGDASLLPENDLPSTFQPFQVRHDTSLLVVVLVTLSLSLRLQVGVPQRDRLLGQLLEMCCVSGHRFTYTSAAKCIAGIVNKYPLLMLLADPELGPEAADGFSLLVSDSTDVLNRASHADIRIMYRQRFFTENVPKLVQGFHSAGKDNKSNYLKALSHVMNSLPKQVLMTELPSLLTLLLEALSCSDQVVQLSTLGCLHPLLQEAPQIVSLHVDTLISKLLSLATSPTMKVRIASLQCMHAMTRLPTHVILPHKARTIRALTQPLDDKKRLVRKEAALARGEWFLLGSPGR